MADPVRIRIQGFFTKAREKNSKGELSRGQDGRVIYDDYVSYYPIGKQQIAVNHMRIDKLMKVSDLYEDNPAYMAAKMRWDFIRPAYEAWKKGQELPDGGTPLAGAQFLRREDIELLKMAGIRSIEELRDMPEGVREQVRLPRIREMQVQAKVFLEMADQQKAQAELEARDAKISVLENEMKEMRAMVAQAAEKRGPGRPPKEANVASD